MALDMVVNHRCNKKPPAYKKARGSNGIDGTIYYKPINSLLYGRG
jgi:hypothetical protein